MSKGKLKEAWKKFKKKKNIYLIIGILILLSIILYMSDSAIKTRYPDSDVVNTWISPIIVFVSTTMFTFAIGELVFSFFDFIEYVQKRLSEVFFSDRFVHILSPEKKKEIKQAINRDLFNTSNDNYLKFLDFFEKHLSKDEYEFYYKEHSNMVSCNKIVIQGEEYRQINNIRTLKFGKKDLGATVHFSDLVKYNFIEIPGIDNNQIFTVNNVLLIKVDPDKPKDSKKENLPFTIEIKPNTDAQFNSSIYNKTVLCKLQTPIKIKENYKIEINYTVLEPLSDLSYVTRLDRFCDNFSVDFSYSENEFKVNLQIFGLGLVPYSNEKNVKKMKNRIKVDFTNCSYPGDGTAFLICPK